MLLKKFEQLLGLLESPFFSVFFIAHTFCWAGSADGVKNVFCDLSGDLP